MEPLRFESKVDVWLVTVIVASLALPAVLATLISISSGRTDQLFILFFALVPPAFLVGFVFKNTYYVVTDDAIIARCLFRRTVPLASIKSLRPTRNPSSAPALSLDRIEIVSDSTGSLLVSPKDRQAFVSAIVTRAPQAAVEGF